MSTATVHDITPAQLKRSMDKKAVAPMASSGLFADMADGTVVAQFFLNFAGFEWNETKFFMHVVSLCGEVGREVYDEELAEYARCTDRTIRAWRADYLARELTTRCSLLVISEGNYNPDHQRYERTGYSVPAHVAELIGQAVAEARALPEYKTNRVAALEKAAGVCYDEIPDAPPKQRRRKPKKSLRSPVIQSISNAAKNLSKGQKALADMPERMRAALLAGQGDDLREMLLTMRNQIADILTVFPEDVEDMEDSYTQENSSGASAQPAEEETHFRVKEEEETRKRPEEPELEHSSSVHAVWEQVTTRLNRPQIERIDVPLCPLELPLAPNICRPPREFMPPDVTEVPGEEEVREQIAVMVESGALDEESACELEQTAHDANMRIAFCKRYMTPPLTE